MHEAGTATVGRWFAARGSTPSRPANFPWLRYVPPLPWNRRFRAPAPWPDPVTEIPPQLRTVAGIWRDPQAEQAAFEQEPIHDFQALYADMLPWLFRNGWAWIIPGMPRGLRVAERMKRVVAAQPAGRPPETDRAAITAAVRREARRVGLSAVGFTPYDPKYVFAEAAERCETGTVIVCVLEQDWERTQQIPSLRSELTAVRTYAELHERMCRLAEFLHARGIRARPHASGIAGINIHYAQEAGLGQLGLNGQLLTPAAGSRCRLALMTTNADLVPDHPVDYGVHAICDACKLCVRRCPPGAIPAKRATHRGVTKAKIKIDRCFPTVVQASGCAICMKVCPVQRYGLDRVRDHFCETGEILGKGTDELEGYTWPLDGRRYGPGEKPRITDALIHPPGLHVDPLRRRPPGAVEPVTEAPRAIG
jgi:ferredoxin